MQLQISHISANTTVLREGRVEDRAAVPGVGELLRETRAEEDALEDVLEEGVDEPMAMQTVVPTLEEQRAARGLLEDGVRLERLLAWAIQNPDADPRYRWSAFDWAEMETCICTEMSEREINNNLNQLRDLGCESLGLTLRSRRDMSERLRKFLDTAAAYRDLKPPGNLVSLRFEEITISSWDGVYPAPGQQRQEVDHTIVRRNATAVLASMFIDPHFYGKLETSYAEHQAPDGQRLFSTAGSSEAYEEACRHTYGSTHLGYDIFADATLEEGMDKSYYNVYITLSGLPEEDKEKPENWALIATAIKDKVKACTETPSEQKRARVALFHKMWPAIAESLCDEDARYGVSVVDLLGVAHVLLPTWHAGRADSPEISALSCTLHCDVCCCGTVEQRALATPALRPAVRDTATTEQLITQMMEAEQKRAAALARDGNTVERRQTKRELKNLIGQLKRIGVHTRRPLVSGFPRCAAYKMFGWNGLHVLWIGCIKNLQDLFVQTVQRRAGHQWRATLVQMDSLLKRWASDYAGLRGRLRTRQLSGVLAEHGLPAQGAVARFARTTKADHQGFAVVHRSLMQATVQSGAVADEDESISSYGGHDEAAAKGLGFFHHFVALTRRRNLKTGQHEWRASELMESERVYPLAIKYLRQGYPSFKFSTYKWHRCGHFGLLVRRKGYTDEGVGEARHKAFKDSIRRSSRRGEDVQAARMAEEEAGLLRGQRMAALRDALLVHTAKCGDAERLQKLLDQHVPPWACDAERNPALHEACRAGHVLCVTKLLNASTSEHRLRVVRRLLSLHDRDGATALVVACRAGNEACVATVLRTALSIFPKCSEVHALTTRKWHGLTAAQWAQIGRPELGPACRRAIEAQLPSLLMPKPTPSALRRVIQMEADLIRNRPLALPKGSLVRSLRLSELKPRSALSLAAPWLQHCLRKALHLYLAGSHDAASRVVDLPELPNGEPLPQVLHVHAGGRFGSEAPQLQPPSPARDEIEQRRRVVSPIFRTPTLDELLASRAHLERGCHFVAFDGDQYHEIYIGRAMLTLSFEHGGCTQGKADEP